MASRRDVLGLIRAGVLALLPAPVAARARHRTAGTPDRAQGDDFGSGHFGHWITDEFGLPAYRYTCDQRTDPKATTPVHGAWRRATDHLHQVGNDRLVAVASNYGHVQVRQDEGAPKFLNDFAPERHCHGAGIGFLTDGKIGLSTWYSRNSPGFERIFGTGYLRKMVAGHGYEIDQVLLAPYGDDPVLISQVRVTNRRNVPAKLRWVEYWGCHAWQLSYRALLQGFVRSGSATHGADLRRQFSDRFTHGFRVLDDGAGLVETKAFCGRTLVDRVTWLVLKSLLWLKPDTFMGPSIPEPATGAGFDDLAPPPTFLVSLDAPADGYATSAAHFFGDGGIEQPTRLFERLGNDAAASGPDSALLLEREFELAPGESRTLHFMYGYLPAGFELNELIGRYREQAPVLWARSSAAWKADGPRLSVKTEPWVERETTWHHYYLRSALTYDSFFGEHILSQGGVYQYVLGFQAAARDPLQHALPFVFSAPQLVREVLRYTLKEIQPDGTIPYGVVGSGVPMPVIFRPSDLELWLLWVVAEYVLATRDTAFLDERIAPYPGRRAAAGDPTIRGLLAARFRHVVDTIGTGEHGLMRLSNGDWSDAIVGEVSAEVRAEIERVGESVLNAAMASYVLDHYARMLEFVGDVGLAATAQDRAQAQRLAVRAQWNAGWFRRAWLGPRTGWVGEREIWLEPQPWAIIGGAATPAQRTQLVATLDRRIRAPSPIGAMLHDPPLPDKDAAGVLTNGGIWPSINGTLIWALAAVDPALAWDEWKKNSLAAHAQAYPDIWYGIWSGPDAYNSIRSRHPGQTMFVEGKDDRGLSWTDFPVMNLHSHAWPLYSAAKLLGVEFHETGVRFAPALPPTDYAFTSSLLGFSRSAGGYAGWYAPLVAGEWEISLPLTPQEKLRFGTLEVNGERRSFDRKDGIVRFAGRGGGGRSLRWAIA